MQDGLILHVFKVHLVEGDVTLQPGIGDRAVRMRLLPGPHLRTGFAFRDPAVLFPGIDQRHRALILLRAFIHHGKNAGSAGQRHRDHIELHADLADGVDEAARQGQKGDDGADGQRIHTAQPQVGQAGDPRGASDQRQQYIQEIAEVAHHRHGDIAEFSGLRGRVAQLFIALIKAFLGLFLAGKNLDHLLPAHHLFHIGIELAKGRLLLDKVGAAAADNDFEHQVEYDREGDHKRGQPHAQIEHGKEGRQGGYQGPEHLRDALGYGLSECIGIVGETAHHITRRVGIKIADRQGLHMAEQLLTDIAQRALLHPDHQIARSPAGRDAHRVGGRHQEDDPDQAGSKPRPARHSAQYMVIDDHAQKQGGGGADRGADDQAEDHQDQAAFKRRHLRQQALDGARLDPHMLSPPSLGPGAFSLIHAIPLLASGIHTLPGRWGLMPSVPRGCRKPPGGPRPSPGSDPRPQPRPPAAR